MPTIDTAAQIVAGQNKEMHFCNATAQNSFFPKLTFEATTARMRSGLSFAPTVAGN